MALIICPECGKQISDQAPACIHCGYPIHNNETTSTKSVPLVSNPIPPKAHDESMGSEEIASSFHKIHEVKMPKEPNMFNPPFIIAICVSVFYVFLIAVAIDPNEFLASGANLFFLGFIILLFIGSRVTYNESMKEYERAKTDFEKYKEEEQAKIAAMYDKFDAMQKAREEEKQTVAIKRHEAKSKGLAACPRCGSTSIVTMHRGYSAFWGAIGSATPVNVCQACGHKFKPGT